MERPLADDYFAKATVDVQISPERIGGAFRSGSPKTKETETQGCGKSGFLWTTFIYSMRDDAGAKAANVCVPELEKQ